MFQAYDEECFKLTTRSVPSLLWGMFRSYDEPFKGLTGCQDRLWKISYLKSLNSYKFIFLSQIWPFTSAVSFGLEGSLFKLYSLHPPSVYQTHRRSADRLIYHIKWIFYIMKIWRMLKISMTKTEAMNARQWDDSACEMHVKHSVNEKYKYCFEWFHTK